MVKKYFYFASQKKYSGLLIKEDTIELDSMFLSEKTNTRYIRIVCNILKLEDSSNFILECQLPNDFIYTVSVELHLFQPNLHKIMLFKSTLESELKKNENKRKMHVMRKLERPQIPDDLLNCIYIFL